MSRKNGLFKLIAGIGIGVGAGMLLSPKSGEENRKDFAESLNKLLDEAKKIDVKEVANDFTSKVNELKKELEDLDKEKAIDLAKEKGEKLKEKTVELIEFAKEKGSPVLEKGAKEIKNTTIVLTKQILKKLENEETKKETK